MLTKTNNKVMLTENAYSWGKKIVQVGIPALSALYFGLGSIWGLPKVEEVVGTLAVLATFIGVCLGISSKQYDASGAAYDGELEVTKPVEGVKRFTLNLSGDPDELVEKKSITFKVNPYIDL